MLQVSFSNDSYFIHVDMSGYNEMMERMCNFGVIGSREKSLEKSSLERVHE